MSNGGEPARLSSLSPDLLDAKLDAFKAEVARHLAETIRQTGERLLREHTALKPLMSLQDVAKTLAVSDRTVEKLVALGRLRPLWIKGQRRFHPDTVDAYLRACAKTSRHR